jgi:hypothetical protein
MIGPWLNNRINDLQTALSHATERADRAEATLVIWAKATVLARLDAGPKASDDRPAVGGAVTGTTEP